MNRFVALSTVFLLKNVYNIFTKKLIICIFKPTSEFSGNLIATNVSLFPVLHCFAKSLLIFLICDLESKKVNMSIDLSTCKTFISIQNKILIS